jgi:hypothetical protein
MSAIKALENQRRQAFRSSAEYKGKARIAAAPLNCERHQPGRNMRYFAATERLADGCDAKVYR